MFYFHSLILDFVPVHNQKGHFWVCIFSSRISSVCFHIKESRRASEHWIPSIFAQPYLTKVFMFLKHNLILFFLALQRVNSRSRYLFIMLIQLEKLFGLSFCLLCSKAPYPPRTTELSGKHSWTYVFLPTFDLILTAHVLSSVARKF